MDRSAALAQVARLVSAFPGSKVPDSSVVLYAAELAPFRAEDVDEAIGELIRHGGRTFYPTLPELLDEARGATGRRLEAERLARPALPEGAPASPEEIHRMFRRYRKRLRARRRAEATETTGG
ncbi:MAG: hypothetical protein ACRDIX_07300 [Actinomycetota bacterium]